MIKKEFEGKYLSLLGFGAMRLPMAGDKVDEGALFDMVDYAMSHGVNYFDTAYPYHSGESERALGKALARYPRESYYLATKFPGHQISEKYEPEKVFEEQLEKCGVEYFDFYLLHNVYERSVSVYKDPRWGIIDYFKEQKRLGRIGHLGFSTHGGLEVMEDFLDYCDGAMEFCQIQLNYLDWTMQRAQEKYEMLTRRSIPIWVMEPVRGGRLAKLAEEDEKLLKALRPGESIASWAFRFLMELPNVNMILSGMSDMDQMKDNVATFSGADVLSDEQREKLLEIGAKMMDLVPCTACRYCAEGCPQQIDIPMLLSVYNEMRFSPSVNASMRVEALEEGKKPTDCLECGCCTSSCPQGIDIPPLLRELSEKLAEMTPWEEISRQRAAAQK